MTLLTNGETISGTFDGTTHGILISTNTFNAKKGDNVILRAIARGYNPAQLTINAFGPSPGLTSVGSAVGVLHLHISTTGTYTVELRYQ